jgi:hypothetical protein
MMWKTLEHYKEFIVNGLDLLSFLFVTQELLKFVQPVVSKVTYYVGLALATLLAVATLVLLNSISSEGKAFFGVGSVLAIYLVVRTTRFMRKRWKEKGPSASDWVASHTFIIGVILFFISRVFAFVLASHQLFDAAG